MKHQKFPRTLDEAFGPYTGHHITETNQPFDKGDLAVIAVSAVILVLVAIGIVWGWLS